MVSVASRELKNRLGRYLQLVREGQPVQITDRGKPIGCILPVSVAGSHRQTETLTRLLASGTLRLGTGRIRRSHKPAIATPGKSVAEMLADDRR
jgi:prevent-host-death family protein